MIKVNDIHLWELYLNCICKRKLIPLAPKSDQGRLSPCNINTKSNRKVMRIKRNINQGITSWSNIKFSKLTLKNWLTDSKENYWWDLGRENVKVTSLFRYIDIYQVCWHKISLYIVLITQIPHLFRVKKCFTLLNPVKKISPSMKNGFPLLGKARCSLVIWWRTATSVQ